MKGRKVKQVIEVDTSGRGRLNRGQRRANMADALCIQETY
jgi:hypothetical protein